jgi:hypothetical protein
VRRRCVILILGTVLSSVAGSNAQQKSANPRVFVTDSDSWETSGKFRATSNGAAGSVKGGARPQTAEIIKTMNESCKDATVTIKEEMADYILVLEHEGGKGLLRKDNKWALFNKDGDAIGSGSTRALGNSVKDACKSMTSDWVRQR